MLCSFLPILQLKAVIELQCHSEYHHLFLVSYFRWTIFVYRLFQKTDRYNSRRCLERVFGSSFARAICWLSHASQSRTFTHITTASKHDNHNKKPRKIKKRMNSTQINTKNKKKKKKKKKINYQKENCLDIPRVSIYYLCPCARRRVSISVVVIEDGKEPTDAEKCEKKKKPKKKSGNCMRLFVNVFF